ncbi:MAG: TRAP transporter substrate-binding protein, partial [Clostridia bacterium]|nr:TRAP transporter substrate-binding protein [Clostridia bacterium]
GPQDVFPIKIAHVLAETDDVHLGFLELEKMLEERSNGRFQVDIFPNAALSSGDEETAELVNSDAVQMACIGYFSVANLNEKLGKFSVLDLPYLFESDDEYYAFVDSDYGQAMRDDVLKSTGNIWAATSYVRSWHCLTSTKDPIYTPADLKGKTTLCQSPVVFKNIVESWGGNVATVAFSEAYTAMQQGAIDAHLRPINLSISQRFYEVQKYATLVNQGAMVNTTLVSNSWYQSLPEDLKGIFMECLDEYEQIMRDFGETRQAESIQQMKDGGVTIIELTDEQKQLWKDAASGVAAKMADVIGQDVIDAATEFLAEYRAQ